MTRFTEEDLKKKGLVKNAKGVYEKMPYKPSITKAMVNKYLEGPSWVESHLTENQMTGYKKELVFSWAGKHLSLNKWYDGTHWREKHKSTDEWHLFFKSFLIEPYPKFDKYSVVLRYNSRLDPDNVITMIKLCSDVLQKEGVIPNDSKDHCRKIEIFPDETMKKKSYHLTFNKIE